MSEEQPKGSWPGPRPPAACPRCGRQTDCFIAAVGFPRKPAPCSRCAGGFPGDLHRIEVEAFSEAAEKKLRTLCYQLGRLEGRAPEAAEEVGKVQKTVDGLFELVARLRSDITR